MSYRTIVFGRRVTHHGDQPKKRKDHQNFHIHVQVIVSPSTVGIDDIILFLFLDKEKLFRLLPRKSLGGNPPEQEIMDLEGWVNRRKCVTIWTIKCRS